MDFEEAKRILAAFEAEGVRYEDPGFQEILVEGIRLRVATPRMLYRMKKETVRPQDRLDAEAIRERFGLEEED